MPNFINLILLYGGRSGEHEVSLCSAASVLAQLDSTKYRIIPIGMDKEGCFYLNDYQELLSHKVSLPVKTANSQPLTGLLINGRLAIDAEVVFPVVHGPLYEDGCLQGVLELAGAAYVGCDVLASAIGMDKDMAKRIACQGDIKTAQYRMLSWYASSAEREQFCQQTAHELGLPLFVKPCSLGSSVGIHKAKNLMELRAAVDDALRYDKSIIVEEFIQGREIELAVLENAIPGGKPAVSTAGEIKVNHPDGFYSYTAKYLESEQTELHIPAQISPNTIARLQTMSADIFTRMKCKGMARVDYFVNEATDEIYFNEINTLPGFTPISMYPKLWEASGLTYPDLLDQLIGLALTHQRCRRQLITSNQ